ncbi:MAG: leucyl/phenylalanyl-tRNA--protein transferase [Sphingomonadaceae bacterium]|nr:leucyl/phenylalanyl-tRNA--protein transferase [Sphingomonadaceae bacterium]
MSAPLDPDLLLRAYSIGVFPMADSREADHVFWVEPKRRAIIPLEGLRVSRSLVRAIRSGGFEVTADRDFAAVIAACAEHRPERLDTWINPEIERAYTELHRRRHAHSIEVWRDGALVGGLYGVRLGAAFFGESMFSRAANASKVALAHLVARLRGAGFLLLDCQFMTDHLASLGAIEVSKAAYASMLDSSLSAGGLGGGSAGASIALSAASSPSGRAGAARRDLDGAFSSGPRTAPWVIAQLLGQTS